MRKKFVSYLILGIMLMAVVPLFPITSVSAAPSGYTFVTSAGDGALVSVDISDPENPVLGDVIQGEGDPNYLSFVQEVWVEGNYAYTLDQDYNALSIFDISDPLDIIHVGNLVGGGSPNYLGFPYDIVVEGDYAYIACRDEDSLTIIDISDPENPVYEGRLSGSGSPNYLNGAGSVTLSGNYAYVCSRTDDSLTIIDISDPSTPTLEGVIYGAGSPNYLNQPSDVEVSGNYAYITAQIDNSLTIIDISDPSAPTFEGNIAGSGDPNYLYLAQDVAVSGKYAYVKSAMDHSLSIFDVSDPSIPTLKGTLVGAGSPNYLGGSSEIEVSGNYAYICAYADDSLTIIDISDPENPVFAGNLMGAGSPNYLYGISSISGMSFFNIECDLEDVDDDGADWVFTDWKYYDWTVTTNIPMVNCSISFLLNVGTEKVYNVFYSDAYNWVYATNQTYETRMGKPCQLKSGTWSYDSGSGIYTVTFGIFFNALVLDLWDASDGVDVYGSYNSSDYFLVNEDYFRIYNEGGFSLNYASSDESRAYVMAGGTPFSFYAKNGSSTYNEVWWRDVNHIKLLPVIQFIAGKEPFTLTYGCDYSLGNGEWLTGWKAIINPDFVSYTGIFAGNYWINMTAYFWDAEGSVRYDDLYMFYHGSVQTEGDRGWFKVWFDLWFSDKNASSVGAARINAYEFPMVDTADWWLRWIASDWGVKDNVLKELSCDSPLLDGDLNSVNSQQIKMVRYWSNLTVSDADGGQIIAITDFDVFDATHSKQLPLVGISNPVFDETKTPTLGQTGLLGALFSMFSGFGQWISENIMFGGLNLWSNFVAFLDTIAGWFGAPHFFNDLFNWLAELFGYLADSIVYLMDIISDIFVLFGSLLSVFLTTMSDIIAALVNTITMFTDMMGGAYGVGMNLWDTLAISSWITVAIIFYPLYLILLWDTQGMDAVIKQLTFLFGILGWVFNFLISLIIFIMSLVERLVESIPVVE